MSALAPLRSRAALAAPATAPTRVPAQRKPTALPRPRLVLVSPQRTTAGRLPFVILVGGLLVVGLVSVLLLHMLAAQDSFRSTALQSRLASLTAEQTALEQQVQAESSPTTLQHRAALLGMVPATVKSLHRLHDGRVVGTQAPVYVPPPVTTTTTKTAKSAKTATSTKTTGKTKTAATTKTAGTTKPTTGATSKSGTTKPGTTTKAGTTTTPPKHHHHRPAKP